MRAEKTHVSVLTIAGSDSGGGAGLQADLKVFAALGVHGTCVITCVTAQNPREVRAIEPVSARVVREQLQAIFDELPPRAAKTGMLHSNRLIQEIADLLEDRNFRELVVDPVMVATSGARLLRSDAIAGLKRRLLPLARLVTPNLDEAEILVGRQLRSIKDLREAARSIFEHYGCAALVKGGHLRNIPRATDIFFNGREEVILSAPFIPGVSTHGTGCTYSAAITAGMARGLSLSAAVRQAKKVITQAIRGSFRVGRYQALNPTATD